jgi:hypothetical protein
MLRFSNDLLYFLLEFLDGKQIRVFQGCLQMRSRCNWQCCAVLHSAYWVWADQSSRWLLFERLQHKNVLFSVNFWDNSWCPLRKLRPHSYPGRLFKNWATFLKHLSKYTFTIRQILNIVSGKPHFAHTTRTSRRTLSSVSDKTVLRPNFEKPEILSVWDSCNRRRSVVLGTWNSFTASRTEMFFCCINRMALRTLSLSYLLLTAASINLLYVIPRHDL